MSETPLATELSPAWKRSIQVIPRGVSSGHRVGWPEAFTRARGAYLWDEDGNQYTDYLNAWGPIVLGHCDPRVNRAVFDAVSTCDITGAGPQNGEAELAERICAAMPSAHKVAFCTSGTDAAMHAVHISRAATGRRKLLKFHGSYHGWSDHLAVGSSRVDLTPTSPLNTPNGAGLHPDVVADVVVVEWNDLLGLQEAFAEYGAELALAIAEPYIHSFGCVPAEPGFLEALRRLCDESGVLLVFDEIKTGFRAALGGYQSLIDVRPDLTIFGKAVANGYSLAGIAGQDDVMGHLGAYTKDRATIDGTYNANPYALAAGNATMQIMVDENVHERLHRLGDSLVAGIREQIRRRGIPAVVNSLGSEWCVYFRAQAPKNFREAMESDPVAYQIYHSALLRKGILEPAFATGDRRLNVSTSYSDIERTVECVGYALDEVVQSGYGQE